MKIKIFQHEFNQGTGSFRPAVGIIAFLLVVSLTLLALPENSGAKEWPIKPITLIVPWPAGGGADLACWCARLRRTIGRRQKNPFYRVFRMCLWYRR